MIETSLKLRIAHVCLASAYTEGMQYQDNMLPAQNRKDGHNVLIVSNCARYVDGKLTTVLPEDKLLADGCRLVRLPFAARLIPNFLVDKIRIAPQLSPLLDSFRPDVIFYHGLVGAEMLTVGAYKKRNPETRLYLDSHADFNNSARSIISRALQYKLLNRFFWRRISKEVDRVFYVSYECRDFLREIYRIPEEKMEFLPLGGFVDEASNRDAIRRKIRKELGFGDQEVLFIHAGKLDLAKKTLNVLKAFLETKNASFRLLIVGSLDAEIEREARQLISMDQRIHFAGWKTGDELIELLCGSDCYVQPGTQSATLQVALCCALPIIVYPHPSHEPYLDGNGYAVRSTEELSKAMQHLEDIKERRSMSLASYGIASRILDYRILAKKLYESR